MRNQLRLATTLLLPLTLVACNNSNNSSGGAPVITPPTLLAQLQLRGLTTLLTAVQAAGLDTLLEGPGPLTLFAPTNAAFASLPPSRLQHLFDPANVVELRALLEYLLVAGQLNGATLEGLTSLTTTQGDDLLIDTPGGVLFINEARVTVRDVQATNGLLHEVNSVVMPPVGLLASLDQRGFVILRDLIDRAGLAGVLTGGNITLVAPSDAAFNALPPGQLDHLRDPMNQQELTDLLSFHMLGGRRTALELLFRGDTANIEGDLLFACVHGFQFRINDIPCSRFNVPATDGLLHLSSSVLTKTVPLRQVITDLGLATLGGLIDLAGLDGPLTAQGTYTILAPTEAAFAALPAGELAALQDPLNTALRLDFLQRHLLLDALQEVEIARRDDLTMENGQVFPVDISNGLQIGGVTVVDGNRLATNGALHALDAVLPGP